MEKGLYKKICSLKKEDNIWNLYDWDGKPLRNPSPNTSSPNAYFPKSLNQRYRNIRKTYGIDEDISCVWFLTGKKNGREEWIQVGRTKTLNNMLSSDIKEDIKAFFYGTGKYGELGKEYSELIFYEIDVIRYIEADKEAQGIFGKMPDDKNLKLAYLVNCAAYIEGKESFENNAVIYVPSTLDGYYHRYFKDRKRKGTGK
ncbi:MAG: hypothetical protein K5886_11260 [Lachnospiraceae bacterium]|nr:hypothetical protein [Lachnospiraceae bacterium]